MGNFYANISLHTEDQDLVIKAIRERQEKAFILPPMNGWIVVFLKRIEDADFIDVGSLTQELSKICHNTAIAVVNHDDDLLWLRICRSGEFMDEYNSAPGYFEGCDSPPSGGDAQVLAAATGQPAAAPILKSILHERSYTVQIDRHKEFAEAIGLPLPSVGFGYRYLERGELPAQVEEHDLKYVQ